MFRIKISLVTLVMLVCALPAQAQKKLKTVEEYLLRASEYLDTKPDKALADYEAALKLDSTYCGVYSNMGGAYSRKKDYKAALAYYSKAIDCARSGDNIQTAPMYIWNRASCKHSMGNYQDALQDYKSIIDLDSTRSIGYTLVATELLYLKQYDEAIKTAQAIKLLSSITEDEKVYADLSIAYAQMFKGDIDAALVIHKTNKGYKFGYTTWKQYVSEHFADFRKAGLPTENMSKVEEVLKISTK